MPVSVRAATYNVHGGVPVHGHFDPGPACQVIRRLDADILALQEVVHGHFKGRRHDAFLAFSGAYGGNEVHGPTQNSDHRTYGNMLLSRWPFVRHVIHDISVHRREPRNVIDAVIEAPGGELRVLATHLGTKAWERRHQADQLAEIVAADRERPTIMMGDLNDWLPLSLLSRTLRHELAFPRRLATFPARWPLLALDRIWLHPAPRRVELSTFRETPVYKASDHLPLVADITW